MLNNLPPAFLFRISFTGDSIESDNTFQEVSGIQATLSTSETHEGEDNRFAYKLPKLAKYEDLVLKRGLLKTDSSILKWCMDTLNKDLNQVIKARDLTVSLIDDKGKALRSWHFKDAWPVAYKASDFDTKENHVMVENLTFSYAYFTADPG